MRSLVLEKNSTTGNIIKVGLKAYGYSVDSRNKIEGLSRLIEQRSYKIIIIDTGMPQLKSVAALRNLIDEINYIKNHLVLSLGIVKKHNWRKKVEFLNAGGDDVIEYPFSLQELLARIQALLRRSTKSKSSLLHLGDISINPSIRQVLTNGKNPVNLRKKEFNILEYMVRNKEKPISRSEILQHVWGYKRVINSNTVDVHISNLRKKLPHEENIQTVYGFGYKASDKPIVRTVDLNNDKKEETLKPL